MEPNSAPERIRVELPAEIGQILEAVRSGGQHVTALLDGGRQRFTSQLLRVDMPERFILFGYSPSKTANSELLAQESVTFRCNDGPAYLEFTARGSREIVHQGAAAIRFPLPEALIRVHRRTQVRTPVAEAPEKAKLRCIADSAGASPFEAQVTDVSAGGLGTIVYSAPVRLEPGMQLPRSKIIFPAGRAVLVNLEVRHVQPVRLDDGTAAYRAGCRFIAGSRDLEELIRVYVREIGTGTA